MTGAKNVSSNSQSWGMLFEQLDQFIVSGKHEQGRQILESYSPKNFPRVWAFRFGDLAFRFNLPIYTLKILQQIMYPTNSFDSKATDDEKLIYSSALSSLGATNEALEILKDVDSEKEPKVLFYRANAYNYDWNYDAAIPFLEKYISAKNLPAYKCLVGKVNLAAALINVGNRLSAEDLLEEIKLECEANSYHMLLGNCYELKAQAEFYKGCYDKALEFLDQAMFYLKDQTGLYSLYVEKWKVICRCLNTNDPAVNTIEELKKLESLRAKALELGHWNSIRECDLFEAVITKDENLFKKVIMGSPSETYRQRARSLFGTNVVSRGHYQLHLGKSGFSKETLQVFDPYSKNGTAEALYNKPMLLNLYEALVMDFYQPLTIGKIFQKIYPGEKFNSYTSPARVLRLLRRLNTWFTENSYSLAVEFKKSEFKLSSETGILVTVNRGTALSSIEGKFLTLKKHFRDHTFSSTEASETLGISKTSAEKLLSQAFDEGRVLKDRKRRGLMSYRLISKPNRRAA